MHELSTMCSPGETADQEGTEGTFPPQLITFLRAVMSFFPNIYQLCSDVQCACASFSGPQLLQPRILLPATRYLVLDIQGPSRIVRPPQVWPSRAKTASRVWSEQSVSDCEYGTIERRVIRRSCSKGEAAGMVEDVGVCHARSVRATWK
jgi:hypothetical protein